MTTYEIENTTYATNDNLTGFFSRANNQNSYNQNSGHGNSQIGFANEKEFQKFCRAYHKQEEFFGEKYADVTATGNFVWRTDA